MVERIGDWGNVRTAPPDVSPKPDVVIRVFMLFSEDELLEWDAALNRAVEDVEVWKGIVNMDNDRMKDEG